MKKTYYNTFLKYLDDENRDASIDYALQLIQEQKVTLEEMYLEILTPSLTEFFCSNEDEEICIWKEHERTSIIRTILESLYVYVIHRKKQIPSKGKTVMVLCPSEEYHEIGAIIVSHFFALSGYDAKYIGANTPKNDIVSAVKALKPDMLALSVTNYYNIVVTKKITEEIKSKYPDVKIIVGGQAFSHKDALSQVQYDYHLSDLTTIASLEGGKSI
ncbi:MAG: cobalamin B12-binding domain-containing protein [Firmicutes bacterium]|nr:cobalamin B12-binding domain-containing protein [Bacillota bacterium]